MSLKKCIQYILYAHTSACLNQYACTLYFALTAWASRASLPFSSHSHWGSVYCSFPALHSARTAALHQGRTEERLGREGWLTACFSKNAPPLSFSVSLSLLTLSLCFGEWTSAWVTELRHASTFTDGRFTHMEIIGKCIFFNGSKLINVVMWRHM